MTVTSKYDICSTKSEFEDVLGDTVYSKCKGSDVLTCLGRGDDSSPDGLTKPQMWELLKVCFRILPAPSSFNIPGEQIDLKESFAQLQKELLTSLPGLVEPCIEKALNKRLGSETPVEEQKAPESTPVRRYVNITLDSGDDGASPFCPRRWENVVKPQVETALKKVPVARERCNSDHMRLYFDTDDQLKKAETALMPLSPVCTVKSFTEKTKLLDPKVTVSDLDESLLDKQRLLEAILDKNDGIKELFSQDHTLKVVYGNKRERFAVIQMSPEVRKLVAESKEKINLGLRQHVVRNRYHVIQCYSCQSFGHMSGADSCPRNSDPRCCFCAGSHETKDCQSKKRNDTGKIKCVNCAEGTGKEDKRHAKTHTASSTLCPYYINEKARLMERTDGVGKEAKNVFLTRSWAELRRRRYGGLAH